MVESNPSILDVNWDTVKGWLFNSNNYSDEKMLKAFIRTQIYRPLFFKYNNYKKFSSNESVYYCVTDKYFIDHVGNEHKVLFTNWPNEYTLNLDGIKTELAHSEYTVDSIKYFPISNKFEYSINYNSV